MRLPLGAKWQQRLAAGWNRARALLSSWLMAVGAAAIGYGVYHWWKGYPYPRVMLAAFVALGGAPLGAGLLLRTPATATTLSLATASFTVSALLQVAVFAISPWSGSAVALLFFLTVAGAAESFGRLRRLRRARGA